MMNDLFMQRMKSYLKDEFREYEASLSLPAFKGIRINTSKIDIDTFLKLQIIDTKPSKICKEAFYIDASTSGLGNHPAHLSGLFYMQEPSAASAVEVLDVQANDYVLDMCSAPGGKTSHMAAWMNNTGTIYACDIHQHKIKLMEKC